MQDSAGHGKTWVPLVRDQLQTLLAEGEASLASISRLTGTSQRTLQRRLAEEGSSLSELLEEVRQELALAALAEGGTSIGALSLRLGYQRQSALTRAVRRWTGKAPSQLRHRDG